MTVTRDTRRDNRDGITVLFGVSHDCPSRPVPSHYVLTSHWSKSPIPIETSPTARATILGMG